jgi:hypothetical protein
MRLRRGISLVAWLIVIGAGAPATTHAETPRWENTLPALRLQVDAQRNRVWALNIDAVYLYDIATRQLIRRVELPRWTMANDIAVCAPDLVLTSAGSALVTSNVMPNIWEIDAQGLTVREHEVALDADTDKDVGFTGLAFGRDGRDLYGVSALHGSAWRIELAAGRARKLRLTEPIRGACGVAVLQKAVAKAGSAKAQAAAKTLCIAGGGPGRRVELSANGKAGRVIATLCIP